MPLLILVTREQLAALFEGINAAAGDFELATKTLRLWLRTNGLDIAEAQVKADFQSNEKGRPADGIIPEPIDQANPQVEVPMEIYKKLRAGGVEQLTDLAFLQADALEAMGITPEERDKLAEVMVQSGLFERLAAVNPPDWIAEWDKKNRAEQAAKIIAFPKKP